MYLDLAGNYLPALLPEQLELQDMLKQHVSFTARNRCLGSNNWYDNGFVKHTDFAKKAHRSVYGPPADYDRLGVLLLQLAAGWGQKKIATLIENVEWHLSLGHIDLLLSRRMVSLTSMQA